MFQTQYLSNRLKSAPSLDRRSLRYLKGIGSASGRILPRWEVDYNTVAGYLDEMLSGCYNSGRLTNSRGQFIRRLPLV